MENQIELLRKWFPKGSTVYTILRKCSASGMSRDIGVVSLFCDKGKVIDRHANFAIHIALNIPLGKTADSVKAQGCGMDMGCDIAYRLSRKLYDDGYALKHRWL